MKQFLQYVAVLGLYASTVSAACSPLELIYARATTEPVGLGAAGKSLAQHLSQDLPGATSYAVNYPASMDLNGGGCKGAQDMIKRLVDQSKACPEQKFALGGHSQGGAVVTAGLPSVPKELLPKIVAVTMFGSPPCSDVTKQVGGRCKSFCNKGDTICDGGGGGPRVKCAGGRVAFLDQEFVDQMSALSEFNNTTTPSFKDVPVVSRAANGCGDDERGHASKGGGGMAAHMAYNQDQYYIQAASCYITKLFKGGA